MDRMRQASGGDITEEQAKQYGLRDFALQQLVDRALIDQEIAYLHLAIGDEVIRQSILADLRFKNEHGEFDPTLYQGVLAANHLTSTQFEAGLRLELAHGELIHAVGDGVKVPDILVDTLFRAHAETRTADMITLPASAAGTPATPSEAELNDFYTSRQNRFRAPERRTITIGLLRLDDFVAKITPSEAELKETYEQRLDELKTPAQVELQQILVPDEAKAKEIRS